MKDTENLLTGFLRIIPFVLVLIFFINNREVHRKIQIISFNKNHLSCYRSCYSPVIAPVMSLLWILLCPCYFSCYFGRFLLFFFMFSLPASNKKHIKRGLASIPLPNGKGARILKEFD
jgi:hypothetical protein